MRPETVDHIVTCSRTLYERVDAWRERGEGKPERHLDEGLADERLERWKALAAQGDAEAFERRLACDGLDEEGARWIVAGDPRRAAEPPWISLLAAIAARGAGNASDRDALDGVRFGSIYAPAVDVAWRRLERAVGEPLWRLEEPARQDLRDTLARRLDRVSARVLGYEWERVSSGASGPEPEDFGRMVCAQLEPLFSKYPVLARLWASTVEDWHSCFEHMLRRLDADHPEICVQLRGKASEGTELVVTRVQHDLSDPHRGGHCVQVLHLRGGDTVVYKPKDLGTEVAWGRLLAWANDRGVEPRFHVPTIVTGPGYGWMEYIEHRSCDERTEVSDFYQRAGGLLALLYALGVTDCHFENMVAHGAHPVLTDMETLMHPAVARTDADGKTRERDATDRVWDSVLRSGLLPRWEYARPRGHAIDISALGCTGVDQRSRPRLGGKLVAAKDHVEALVAGFECIYRLLVDQRPALWAGAGPLADLHDQRIRVVLRPTRVYGAILRKALEPEYMTDAIDRSIEQDVLGRGYVGESGRERGWPVAVAEHRALDRGDIPYFGTASSDAALSVGVDDPVEGFFQRPAVHDVRDRLARMDETDLGFQRALIRGALTAGSITASPGHAHVATVAPDDATAILSPSELLAEAVRLAEELASSSIAGADGSVTWVGLAARPDLERVQLDPLDDTLYSGRLGVALFLAAADHVVEHDRFGELAKCAVRPLCTRLSAKADARGGGTMRAPALGIGAGVGGNVYGLTRLHALTGDDRYLEIATIEALALEPAAIVQDEVFDLMSGCAGLLLALLALHRRTEDGRLLERARVCADHLVANRRSYEGSPAAWTTLASRPLTGLSHGASGIAYALDRLHAIDGHPGLREAVQDALDYEAGLYLPERGNWPDFRSEDDDPMNGWCNGAPGIVLSRLVMSGAHGHIEPRVIETLASPEHTTVDHLCCGTLGRADVVLLLGEQPGAREARRRMHQQVSACVRAAHVRGGYRLLPSVREPVFNPSLFQGTAGIGYQLLRLARPERFSSILTIG
ncbi:MAG: type 2 lantipeptide synthetase LanM family protein [Deltaproteobacteria bacterium]|nr:type 2 lantipeptide synthetase LanM family protein [Deltaproteobacteria bacterium]